MNIFDTSGLIDGATDEITVASSSKSIEVMNMSHLALDVTGDTQGLMFTLQPFQSKAKVVNSGQTVQFKLHQPITQAIQNPNEYVQVNQSTEPTESAVQALAFVPVYTDNVQLSGTNTVDIASGSSIGINGVPTVEFAAGQTVGINGTTTVQFGTPQEVTLSATAPVNVVASTVTQDAKVVNDFLTIDPLFLVATLDINVSNLANGGSIGDSGALLPQAAFIDEIIYFYVSNKGYKYDYLYSSGFFSGDGNYVDGYTTMINTGIKHGNGVPLASIGTVSLSPPAAINSINVTIQNNTGSTIISDTVTLYIYGKYASMESFLSSQQQITPFNIPATVLSTNGQTTTPIYTASIPATNIKKMTVELQQTSASGLIGTMYFSGSVFSLVAELQVSNDGANFSAPQGYDTNVNQGVVNGWIHPYAILNSYTNGAINVTTDSSNVLTTTPAGIPAMASGYPYIRFAIYIETQGGSGSATVSASGNLIVNYLE